MQGRSEGGDGVKSFTPHSPLDFQRHFPTLLRPPGQQSEFPPVLFALPYRSNLPRIPPGPLLPPPPTFFCVFFFTLRDATGTSPHSEARMGTMVYRHDMPEPRRSKSQKPQKNRGEGSF